ncbi:tRNA (guanine-N(7)-)-methyltransferase isoform X3 [Phaenicophaeus curvirostris]|uniref:tRNA (guanine-N(7)-)-methyltransferase isoform X3 n=1 Tax=Phaenicophaeus curvirostris TaxID=33595 RepID=UPI0037F0F6B4
MAAEVAAPQKRFYRQRAHANPLADRGLRHPPRPQDMDWAELFPDFFPPAAPPGQPPPRVEFADLGCGYGGLLVALSPLFPGSLMLGLELRAKVAAFAGQRLRALRAARPGAFGNVAVLRGNAMKHLPHFFCKGQGLVYTVTDVPELHEWMVTHFGEHPLFEAVPPEELEADPVAALLATATEEGRKVQRAGRPVFPAVFRRCQDPDPGGAL